MPHKDPDKRREFQRKWAAAKRAANPEPFRENERRWREANRLAIRRKDLRIRGRKRLESLIQQAEEMYD